MKRILKKRMWLAGASVLAIVLGSGAANAVVFGFTGSATQYIIPSTGWYDFAVAGAQGGGDYSDLFNGGDGALSAASFSSRLARHWTSSWANGARPEKRHHIVTAVPPVAAAVALCLVRALCCLPRGEEAAIVFLVPPDPPLESVLAAIRPVRRAMEAQAGAAFPILRGSGACRRSQDPFPMAALGRGFVSRRVSVLPARLRGASAAAVAAAIMAEGVAEALREAVAGSPVAHTARAATLM